MIQSAQDNLLLHLPFNETNGSIAYDHSGRANHGKLIDQASWSVGKNEGAISFDGRNDGLVLKKLQDLIDRMPLRLPFGLREMAKWRLFPQITRLTI